MARKGSANKTAAVDYESGGYRETETGMTQPSTGPWDQAWDQVLEGSSAARTKGIRLVCKQMQCTFDSDRIASSTDKVLDTAMTALSRRKPDSKEQAAAADMLALLFISLGRQCDGPLDTVTHVLRDACRDGKARSTCISATAIAAFCATGSDADDVNAIRFLAGLWLTQTGEAQVAALKGWALVMCRVDVRALSSPLIEAFLEALSSILATSKVTSRNAAATALGILYERCGLHPDAPDDSLTPPVQSPVNGDANGAADASSEAGHSPAVRNGKYTLEGGACQVGTEARQVLESGFSDIMTRLGDLATNRGDANKLNKKNKSTSKTCARDVLAQMAGSKVNVESFKLPNGGEKILLDTLSLQLIKSSLCAVLASGFQVHMSKNDFLTDAFGSTVSDTPHCGRAEFAADQWKVSNTGVSQTCVANTRALHVKRSYQMAAHMLEDN